MDILEETKKLSDGTFERIFSRNDMNFFGIFTYNCHLCNIENLPGESALKTHIGGKKHRGRLLPNYIPNANKFRATLFTLKCEIKFHYFNLF